MSIGLDFGIGLVFGMSIINSKGTPLTGRGVEMPWLSDTEDEEAADTLGVLPWMLFLVRYLLRLVIDVSGGREIFKHCFHDSVLRRGATGC